MPLDAAIGQLFAPYCLGGRHGHRFWRTKLSCGVVKPLFEASIQKAQNRPSTQLIRMWWYDAGIPVFARISHWMPPLGKCLHGIAPVAAMVDNFGGKHKTL